MDPNMLANERLLIEKFAPFKIGAVMVVRGEAKIVTRIDVEVDSHDDCVNFRYWLNGEKSDEAYTHLL